MTDAIATIRKTLTTTDDSGCWRWLRRLPLARLGSKGSHRTLHSDFLRMHARRADNLRLEVAAMWLAFVAGYILGSVSLYVSLILTAREPQNDRCVDCYLSRCQECPYLVDTAAPARRAA